MCRRLISGFLRASLVLGWLVVPASAQQFPGSASESLAPAEQASRDRITIAPWTIKVLGKSFDHFENEEASRVLEGWMTNAIMDMRRFDVVNREDLELVLTEIAIEPYDANPSDLVKAGQLVRADYVLLGRFINLEQASEIDFKLLDVASSTYSDRLSLQDRIPFNPSLESARPVIGRVVGELASSFPVTTEVLQILGPARLLIAAGSRDGVEELHPVTLLRPGFGEVGRGAVVTTEPTTALVELEGPLRSGLADELQVEVRTAPGAEAVLWIVRRHLREGREEQALEILANATSKYPDHAQLHAAFARLCWQRRDYENALRSFRRALELEPNDEELLADATAALLEAGEYSEVIRRLENRDRSLVLEVRLGRAYELHGYDQRARESYLSARLQNPEHPEPHLRSAVLAYKAGRRDEGRRELEAALRLDPTSLEAEIIGRVAAAIQSTAPLDLPAILAAAERSGSFEILATAAELLLAAEDRWSEALELARASLEINPSYVWARVIHSLAVARGGDVERAISDLDRVMQDRGANVVLLLASSDLLLRVDRPDLAAQRILQAADLAPYFWRPQEALGDLHHGQGRHLEAVAAYQKALDIAESTQDPEVPRLLFKIGRAGVQAGLYAQARPFLERCIGSSPDHQRCHYYLGLCFFHDDIAELDHRAIVSLEASNGVIPESHYYLGRLRERRDELERAAEHYRRCLETTCEHAEDAEARVDRLESIQGRVIGTASRLKEASLDIGRIHGVLPGQLVTMLNGHKVKGTLLVTEVQDETSQAEYKKGKPMTGYDVRVRPARPKGLSARPADDGKGIQIGWHQSPEPEISKYVLYRRRVGDGRGWRERAKIRRGNFHFRDKRVKPGTTYVYRLTAATDTGQESLPSIEEIEVRYE